MDIAIDKNRMTQQTEKNGRSSASDGLLDYNDFLRLLFVQLQNQDPTNPMDNNAMIAQLAQFSALGLQQENTDLMKEMLVIAQRNEQFAATGYIGKTVRAKGFELSKDGDKISTLYYSSNQPIEEGKLYIYGADKEIIYTEEIGAKQAGFYEYQWDGKDSTGKVMPDGTYTVAIEAKTDEGKPILVHTEVSGEVVSAVTENGQTYLRLTDGRIVLLDSVYEVYVTKDPTKPEEDKDPTTPGGDKDPTTPGGDKDPTTPGGDKDPITVRDIIDPQKSSEEPTSLMRKKIERFYRKQ